MSKALQNRTCSECGRVLSRSHDLDRHMKIHDPSAKRFVCPEKGCTFSSLQRRNMTTHQATHTGNKDHLCQDDPINCNFKTGDPAVLIRHRKNAHGYVPRKYHYNTPKDSGDPVDGPSTSCGEKGRIGDVPIARGSKPRVEYRWLPYPISPASATTSLASSSPPSLCSTSSSKGSPVPTSPSSTSFGPTPSTNSHRKDWVCDMDPDMCQYATTHLNDFLLHLDEIHDYVPTEIVDYWTCTDAPDVCHFYTTEADEMIRHRVEEHRDQSNARKK